MPQIKLSLDSKRRSGLKSTSDVANGQRESERRGDFSDERRSGAMCCSGCLECHQKSESKPRQARQGKRSRLLSPFHIMRSCRRKECGEAGPISNEIPRKRGLTRRPFMAAVDGCMGARFPFNAFSLLREREKGALQLPLSGAWYNVV